MPDEKGGNRGRRTGRSRVAAGGRRGRRARGARETGRVRGVSKRALSPQAAVAEALLELLEKCGDALGFDVGRNWPTDLGAVDLVWFHDLGILVPELGRIPALERRLPVVAFEIEGGGTSPKRVNAASLRLAGLSPALGVVVLGPDSGDDGSIRALQEAARGWLHRLGTHSLAVWTFEDVRALAGLVVEKLRAVRRRAERGGAAGEAGRAEKLVALAGSAKAGGRRGRRGRQAAAGALIGRARPALPLPDPAAVNAVVAKSDINKSEKIRRLTDLGVPRTRIAELLGIKYQFVYNVEKRYREQGAAGGGRKRRTRRSRAPAGTKRARRGPRRVAKAAAAGAVEAGKRRRGRPAKRRRPRIKAEAAGVPGAAGTESGGQPAPGVPAAGDGAAR